MVRNSGGGSGAGGNRTSGDRSILGGNQIVAPINAPINVCGNAVAVLGDAAAGCLGGAHVGGPSGRPGGGRNGDGPGDWNGGGHGGDYGHRIGKHRTSGLMSSFPMASASDAKDTGSASRQASDVAALPALPALPLIEELKGAAAMPELPIVGEAQKVAGLPATPGSAEAPTSRDSVTESAPSSPLGGVVPLGDVGLMSAAQPAGMTGMNSGALFALVLGATAAASATLFATTRRIRFGRK
ncbi:chaplin family protein [Streptosporangium lutulentum]